MILNQKRIELDHMIKEPEYGWLSPLGVFIKGDWGEHESTALEIIQKNYWEDEYTVSHAYNDPTHL